MVDDSKLRGWQEHAGESFECDSDERVTTQNMKSIRMIKIYHVHVFHPSREQRRSHCYWVYSLIANRNKILLKKGVLYFENIISCIKSDCNCVHWMKMIIWINKCALNVKDLCFWSTRPICYFVFALIWLPSLLSFLLLSLLSLVNKVSLVIIWNINKTPEFFFYSAKSDFIKSYFGHFSHVNPHCSNVITLKRLN